jgi:hypothetical protein
MFSVSAGNLLAVFVVVVAIPLVVIGCVEMFLSILDYSRNVPTHTLRRIH